MHTVYMYVHVRYTYLQLSLHLSDEVSEYLTGAVADVRASREEIGTADDSRLTQ